MHSDLEYLDIRGHKQMRQICVKPTNFAHKCGNYALFYVGILQNMSDMPKTLWRFFSFIVIPNLLYRAGHIKIFVDFVEIF